MKSRRALSTGFGILALIVFWLPGLAVGHPRPRATRESGGLSVRQLLARDPGARLGANTIVATGRGDMVFGVPSRPNFIVGLGSRETIVGGASDDQIKAFGSKVTIRGGRGDDLIYGGPGGMLIGGPGRDLLIDAGAHATVRITGKHTEAILSGKHDRVLCSSRSGDDVIYAAAGTAIASSCRRVHDRILSIKDLRAHGLATLAAASSVTGDGSNGNPFVAPCANPGLVDCIVNQFATRRLNGFWANEYVPAYRCPSDHPYLFSDRFVPGGVLVPRGVEIVQGHPSSAWPIGIVISLWSETRTSIGTIATGTTTGFSNSTATNWTLGTAAYQVILHCTSEKSHGWVTALP